MKAVDYGFQKHIYHNYSFSICLDILISICEHYHNKIK